MDIIQISWRDIPGRDKAWYENEKSRMTEDAIAAELDINYEKSSRSVIYREFKEHHIVRGAFKINPQLPVIRVLDYGKTCCCLFSQKDNFGRLFYFKEILFEDIENPAHTLARAVQSYSADLVCAGFRDFDDPAGTHDNYNNKDETSWKIVQQYGIHPTHSVSAADQKRRRNRIELVKSKLCEWYDDKPVVGVHESLKNTLDALQSGYRYYEDKLTKKVTDTILEEHPHEDLADCFGITMVETLTITAQHTPKRRPPSRGNRYTG